MVILTLDAIFSKQYGLETSYLNAETSNYVLCQKPRFNVSFKGPKFS